MMKPAVLSPHAGGKSFISHKILITLITCHKRVKLKGSLSYFQGACIGIDDEDDSTFTINVDDKTFHFQGTSFLVWYEICIFV